MRTRKRAEDSVMWPSNMTIEIDDEQIETLVNYRNDLDHRMINNVDSTYLKYEIFHESQKVTKFINEYRKRKNNERKSYRFDREI